MRLSKVSWVRLGLDRERHGDAIAEPIDHGAAGRIEPQKRAAAGRRPKAAIAVESKVEDRLVKRRPGRSRLAALAREAIDLTAIGAAGDEDRAVWRLDHSHRTDAAVGAGDTRCKGAGAERREDRLELADCRQRSGRRGRADGAEQRINGGFGRGLGRLAEIGRRRARHGG
jgi:hypothetical protein